MLSTIGILGFCVIAQFVVIIIYARAFAKAITELINAKVLAQDLINAANIIMIKIKQRDEELTKNEIDILCALKGVLKRNLNAKTKKVK